MTSTREWIQIDREDAAEYEKDLELFQASIEFVKAARGRSAGGGILIRTVFYRVRQSTR